MIKRHQFENLIPLSLTIASVIVLYFYFSVTIYDFLGILITLLGLILWWWGKIDLGESFSALPKAKRLVTHGIYSRIRNPIYVGLTFVLVGWSLIMNSLLMWIITLVITISSVIRAHLEAKILYGKFGKEYLEYKKKTWF